LFISFRLRNKSERLPGEPQLTAAVTSNPRPHYLGPRQRQSDFPDRCSAFSPKCVILAYGTSGRRIHGSPDHQSIWLEMVV
jgi:hypothetical protein